MRARLGPSFALRCALAWLALAGGGPRAASDVAPGRERYVIDPARSRLSVETQTSGLASMFGHDHKFDARTLSGEASLRAGALEAGALEGGALELTVEADSLWLMEDVGDSAHLTVERALRDRVLETARHPRIVFRCRAITVDGREGGALDVRLAGELGLHGVRRRLTVPARVTLRPDGFRATGAVEIRQTDFKIVPFVFAGGTVRVRDRVLVSFDVVGTRAP